MDYLYRGRYKPECISRVPYSTNVEGAPGRFCDLVRGGTAFSTAGGIR